MFSVYFSVFFLSTLVMFVVFSLLFSYVIVLAPLSQVFITY